MNKEQEQYPQKYNLYRGDLCLTLEVMPGTNGYSYHFHLNDNDPGYVVDKVLPQTEGAHLLVGMLKDGWQMYDVPEFVINALIQPTEWHKSNRLLWQYDYMDAQKIVNGLDDDEAYYHRPACDCEAPLIETSYYQDEHNAIIYRVAVHHPLARFRVDINGNVSRAYRRSFEIAPSKEFDYDDLSLVCSHCGARY